MFRKIYATGVVVVVCFVAFQFMADPRVVAVWNYV